MRTTIENMMQILLISCLLYIPGFVVAAKVWQPVDLGEPGTGFRKVPFLRRHGWAVTGATDKGVVGMPDQDYILHTANGGDTWERLPITVDQIILDLCFVDEHEGWMVVGLWGSWNELLHTTDGGSNWEAIPYTTQDDIEPPGQPSLVKLHFFNASEGIAMFQNLGLIGGDLLISRTEDGGNTWNQKILQRDITGGPWDFVEDYAWIGLQDNGMYRSVDRGISWEILNSPGVCFERIDFVTANEGWAVSTPHGCGGSVYEVYYTSNGGDTWELQFAAKSQDTISSIAFINSTQGWIVQDTLTAEPNDTVRLLGTLDGGFTWEEEILPVRCPGNCSGDTMIVPSTWNNQLWIFFDDSYSQRVLRSTGGVVSVQPQGKLPALWGILRTKHLQ